MSAVEHLGWAEPTTREPPHSFEAEQALLGTLLLDNRRIDQVAEFQMTCCFRANRRPISDLSKA